MKNTLKNKAIINDLFTVGKRVNTKNLMLRVMAGDNAYLVTVSTKNFPRAVDRNRIKRLMREVVRNSKIKGTFALVYTGKAMPTLDLLMQEFNVLR